jgi:hypothetical protein
MKIVLKNKMTERLSKKRPKAVFYTDSTVLTNKK